ncbi:MAG: arginine--tRNA ligase [Caldithrix sp.]|nr:arginine--tRNA ligase [Caldithrix sp.]
MTSEEYIRQELSRFLRKHQIEDIDIILEKPKDEKFGDYASNLAMQLARHLRKNPRQIAEEIKAYITLNDAFITKIEIAGPGFINFFASTLNLNTQLKTIRDSGEEYGRSSKGQGQTVQIEFVSANPTGPLTVGHGRAAVLGDTIARLYEAIGYRVTREYYFNNAGRQMRILGQSVQLRYLQRLGKTINFPEDHYQGEYINDIARLLYDKYGEQLQDETDLQIFKEFAEKEIFKNIKQTVKRLGFAFDVFFNEHTLYEQKKIEDVLNGLREKQLLEDREGASWFLTSKLGFESDRVFVKSSGEPTYRLPDTAYHIDKVKRGFDLMIDIFGADHIDTYPDVLAAVKALEYDVSKFKVLIHQFVTLTEGGETIKMSTRKANFVTLDQLLDDIGSDVTRYFFLMRNMNAHLNFDLQLARKHSDENPVYYIQYAHARINSILKLAQSKQVYLKNDADLNVLVRDEERNLIKHLIEFPSVIEDSACKFEPHRLINYLFDTATLFHKFYTECRVISEDEPLTQGRLLLIDACRIVFRNGLHTLGISAPEQM